MHHVFTRNNELFFSREYLDDMIGLVRGPKTNRRNCCKNGVYHVILNLCFGFKYHWLIAINLILSDSRYGTSERHGIKFSRS